MKLRPLTACPWFNHWSTFYHSSVTESHSCRAILKMVQYVYCQCKICTRGSYISKFRKKGNINPFQGKIPAQANRERLTVNII